MRRDAGQLVGGLSSGDRSRVPRPKSYPEVEVVSGGRCDTHEAELFHVEQFW